MKYRLLVVSTIVATVFAIAGSNRLFADDAAKHPCKDKRMAKHAARKTLHECIEQWAKDHHQGDSDPSDDCSSKLQAFVQASKDVKACVTQHGMKE